MASSFTDGAAYERLMGRWSQRVASPFLDWMGAGPGLDWIDVGCGNGAVMEMVSATPPLGGWWGSTRPRSRSPMRRRGWSGPAALSALEPMHALWVAGRLTGVKSQRIDITVEFADFDDFWASSSIPIGPQVQLLAGLSPAQTDELKAFLRQMLPPAPDGAIRYPAFANVVKGHVAG